MEFLEIKMSKIDTLDEKIESINYKDFGIDLEEYLDGLAMLITKGSSGRKFKFDSETTEVRLQLNEIYNKTDFEKTTTIISKRLLKSEIAVQKRMAKLDVEIQKGIFIQLLIDNDGVIKFIMCKADHGDFLNEVNFEKTKGLPLKKKLFKAFVCTIAESGDIEDIIVYDTNTNVAKYWWDDFLELSKIYSDEDNTINAFDAIDKGVLSTLKVKYPHDYMHLSNNTIHYFRSHEKFDLLEYIESTFLNYEVVDKELDLSDVVKKIKELPTKKRAPFDEQFSIVKNKITKKFIKDIQLTEQIELRFKQEIKNLDDIVTYEEGKDGEKFVKIRSERGYEFFKQLKANKQ